MKKERAIKPDVINILCRDPHPSRCVSHEPIPMPESKPEPEPKKPFWGKVEGLFQKAGAVLNKAATFIAPIVAFMSGAAALLNAVARYKDVSRKSNKTRKASQPYNTPAGTCA